MANTLLTPTMVTREALRVLHQKLKFVGNINRQYDDSFAKTGAKIGQTLQIRLPNQFQVRKGVSLSAQDTAESSVALAVASQYGVDLNFTSVDLTLSLDDFSKRIIQPSMAVLAASIEGDMLSDAWKAVWNTSTNFGSAGTFNKILGARKKLVDNLAPPGDWALNVQTQDMVDLTDSLKGLFQDSDQISKQYIEGYIGRTAGFKWYENTLLPAHVRGLNSGGFTTDTRTSALTINTTAISSLTVSAIPAGGLNAGDVFTIGSVYRVHPETKLQTNVLQQFVVTTAAVSGATTLSFAPSIVLSGAYQNVTIPTVSATAAVTAEGTAGSTFPVSLAFQQDAFAAAFADLQMPRGVDFSAREVQDGISMRIVRAYDINNDKFPCRLDVLFGFKAIRPQLACRIENNGA